jgi:aspartate/methionine/tyrosine aminotransferase
MKPKKRRMNLADFQLERYFAKHEFTAKYLLSSSDCDGYALKYVLDIASKNELALWDGMKLGYTESAGNALLREAILQYYAIKTIDNVVVASPGELNFISMNVLLKAGDHAISMAPCYQSLSEVVKSLPCELSYWKPNPSTWEFDITDLENLIRPSTKLLIINFPHNPTGTYLSRRHLNAIITIASKYDLYIFSDEMYHKLMLDGTEENPPICDLYEKGISLWGTSKTFGLAGLRTGWLVTQDTKFLNKLMAFKDYLSICNSAPSEILSIIALNHIDHFLGPNLDKIQKNMALFKAFSKEHDLIASFVPPKAGSIAFVQLNIENSSLDFCDRLLKETGIMAVPAEMFEYSGRFIRVGFGRKNFPEVLAVLSQFAATL